MTSSAVRAVSHDGAASAAVQRASRLLLACQHQDGWWPDRATAEVTDAAEGLLALELLAIRTPAATTVAAGQIRLAQRADGSWAGGEPGAAADLSASVLAYLALRLAGDPPDAYHMAAAAGWIRDAGGVDAVGPTAQVWLAMFGLTAWASLPVPVPEPSRVCARATTAAGTRSPVTSVTLAVLGMLRPARPAVASLTELQATGRQTPPPPVAVTGAGSVRSARSAALRRCGRWLADWELQAAAAGQRRPGWPLTLVALHALGYPPSHPAQAAGLARLRTADRPPGWCWAVLQPVAQTALAIEALSASGLQADHSALLAAGRWLLGQQIAAVAVDPAARGGPRLHGWSFCPDGCPRPADTACVLTALGGIDARAVGGSGSAGAARWLTQTQGRDGSWAGSAAVTGYCVRALASEPAQQPPVVRAVRHGVVWLLRAQHPLGAWPDGHGGSDLLATTVALTALRAAGVLAGKPAVTGAVGWLLAEQNADGGWHLGELAGPRRPGCSDAAGTAQAMTALLAVGGEARPGVHAAAEWLIRAQLPDGSWPVRSVAADRPTMARRQPDAEQSPIAGALLPLAALGRYLTAGTAAR